MKLSGFWLVLLLGSLGAASAQVSVEVTLDQEQFLPGEALPVAVRITNRSGQTLHLGAEENWLTFSLTSREGLIVAKTSEAPVTGEFILESSKVAIKHVDLAPYFGLTTPGRFGIVATVHIRAWGYDKESPAKFFTVIEGAKIWEQEFGIPAADNSSPEVRKYILQQANYIRGQLRLYLRVTDPYGRAVRVVPIGRMVSFGRPDAPQIDKRSNLHVLYQNGATTFSYTVYNPEGELLVRQTHDYINTRPRLRVDDQGSIAVAGGVRRVTSNDVPPAADSTETSKLPPPTDAEAGLPSSTSETKPTSPDAVSEPAKPQKP